MIDDEKNLFAQVFGFTVAGSADHLWVSSPQLDQQIYFTDEFLSNESFEKVFEVYFDLRRQFFESTLEEQRKLYERLRNKLEE